MAKNDAQPIKIVITGPESCGKTTLAQDLASHYHTAYVPEYARNFLQQTKGNYTREDLQTIAKGQIALEDNLRQKNPPLLICDTSLEVIRVWSEWKYGHCDPFILTRARQRAPHLFLLLTPDIPWQADPLRENPGERQALFARYQKILAEYGKPVTTITGKQPARVAAAINAIDKIRRQ